MNTVSDERGLPFHSGPQRARVCLALLALVDAAERWTPTGPALAAREAPSDPDVRRILAACWALWEGCSTLSLDELLLLRPSLLEAVGELIAALARGPAAVDAWLARFEPAQGSSASPTPSRRVAAAGHLKVTR